MDIRTIKERTIEFFYLQVKKLQLPNWWRDPLLVTTNADERFDILPQIAANTHMLPHDLLDSCRTVIVFFIPFTEELSNGNIDGKFPSVYRECLVVFKLQFLRIGQLIHGDLVHEALPSWVLAFQTHRYSDKNVDTIYQHRL